MSDEGKWELGIAPADVVGLPNYPKTYDENILADLLVPGQYSKYCISEEDRKRHDSWATMTHADRLAEIAKGSAAMRRFWFKKNQVRYPQGADVSIYGAPVEVKGVSIDNESGTITIKVLSLHEERKDEVHGPDHPFIVGG